MHNTNKINSGNSIVWSYSIYGDDIDKYYKAVINNINVSRIKCKDVIIVISTTLTYEKLVNNYFKDYVNHIEILVYDDLILSKYPKLLRFLVSEVIDAQYYFFKDSDSIVTTKEIKYMNKWIEDSQSSAFIMRDHPAHVAPIMAGMFGVSSKTTEILVKSLYDSLRTNLTLFKDSYSYDQDWLMKIVYPEIIKEAAVFSSYLYYSGENVTFIERDPKNFIGARFFEEYPSDLSSLPYYSWYGERMLCAPSYIRKILSGHIRFTIIMAYLYTITLNNCCKKRKDIQKS